MSRTSARFGNHRASAACISTPSESRNRYWPAPTINIEIAAGSQVTFSLLWNRDGDTYDYDFYLFDSDFNQLASSTNGSDYYEWFSWTNNGANWPILAPMARE